MKLFFLFAVLGYNAFADIAILEDSGPVEEIDSWMRLIQNATDAPTEAPTPDPSPAPTPAPTCPEDINCHTLKRKKCLKAKYCTFSAGSCSSILVPSPAPTNAKPKDCLGKTKRQWQNAPCCKWDPLKKNGYQCVVRKPFRPPKTDDNGCAIITPAPVTTPAPVASVVCNRILLKRLCVEEKCCGYDNTKPHGKKCQNKKGCTA